MTILEISKISLFYIFEREREERDIGAERDSEIDRTTSIEQATKCIKIEIDLYTLFFLPCVSKIFYKITIILETSKISVFYIYERERVKRLPNEFSETI
jgi:hypothetical protein